MATVHECDLCHTQMTTVMYQKDAEGHTLEVCPACEARGGKAPEEPQEYVPA